MTITHRWIILQNDSVRILSELVVNRRWWLWPSPSTFHRRGSSKPAVTGQTSCDGLSIVVLEFSQNPFCGSDDTDTWNQQIVASVKTPLLSWSWVFIIFYIFYNWHIELYVNNYSLSVKWFSRINISTLAEKRLLVVLDRIGPGSNGSISPWSIF